MKLMDLLKISISNLRRRKLRSFLTILGVVIGTAAIVTMISLGIGLQRTLFAEVEENGGATTIRVTGAATEEDIFYYEDESQEESVKNIDDKAIKKFTDIEHVKACSPVYQLSALLLKGKYEGYIDIYGTTKENLKSKNLSLALGTLPKDNGSKVEFVYGNGLLTSFYEKGSNRGYYETGELPDIDLAKDSMFLVLDMDAYYDSQESEGMETQQDNTQNNEEKKAKSVNKIAVRSSGVIAGDIEAYNQYYYIALCDIDVLKIMLKKQYGSGVIPGQPTTKSGKPYKEFYYTGAEVVVDKVENVDDVVNVIKNMGYKTDTNQEFLDSVKGQSLIIQAVLGGIGAVSLLVAAIGIANTMMMSVYERTKEIGIMKVLGCDLKSIKRMFLYEAAGVGAIGGILGSLLSYLMSFIINGVVSNIQDMNVGQTSYIPFWLVLVAIVFSILVGVIAGLMPALRAMKLSPIAAIRSE